MSRRVFLSKSKLMSARQCLKRLHLEVHHPELKEISADTQAAFRKGNEIGDVSRQIYGDDQSVFIPYEGGWMFTHVATYDGPIAALNAVKGAGRSVDYRVVPRVIFSDPALAAVGLTETEASEQGYDVAVGNVRVDGARAMAIGDRRGRLKAVVNRADGEILGFHILAPHGDDLLHEAVAAMHDHGRIERIGKSIHAHPTLSEMVKAAAKAAK